MAHSVTNIGKRKLKLKIDAVEYTATVSNVEIVVADADNDYVTFEDAANGGARVYTLKMTLAQDAASGSLWRKVWDSAGADVPCTVAPYGNGTLTATNPGFIGTATIKEPNGTILGGDADASSTATQTIDVEWPYLAKPVLTGTGSF